MKNNEEVNKVIVTEKEQKAYEIIFEMNGKMSLKMM